MTSKKELVFAFTLTVVFFAVGIISYAAFPEKKPEQPVRLMFKGVAGNVLFDHKTHMSDSGYGIGCSDCHHNLEEGETEPEACGACHEPQSEDEDVPGRKDAFHNQCIGCHNESEAGPEECASCHVM